MKRSTITVVLLALMLTTSILTAQKAKELESRATVTAEQAIRMDGFNGADLIVRTWDRPEVMIKLDIRIEMSSSDAEDEYLRDLRLEKDESSGLVVFRLDQPSIDAGLTLKNILKLRFNTYAKKEIRGEVFLPKANAFHAEVRYGKLDIEGLGGVVEIESQSASIDVRSCDQLETIQNDYGTTSILESGGHLTINNKSGKLDIKTFKGPLTIRARYATVTAGKVTGMVDVESQSGTVSLTDIGSDVTVDAPYSNIIVENVDGSASLKCKSGSVRVAKVAGLEIDAPYTTIEAQDVKGVPNRAVIITGQSGRISLTRIESAVDIQSPYTNIDLTEIGGEVRLGTKSGNVRASAVRGNWTSMTEYSRLTLSDIKASRVIIENKSGGVDLGLTIVPETVEIVNSYADVTLTLPAGLDADVRLKSEYGSISSDLPVRVETVGSGSIALGKTGKGTGSLSIETTSGNIRVREK